MVETIIEMEEKITRGDYNHPEYPTIRPAYKPDYIFDEEASVRWNREEVIRKNAERDQVLKDFRQACNLREEAFREDLRTMLTSEYDFTDEKLLNMIISKAWERGHHGGYHEILVCAEEIADLAFEIIRTLGENRE